MIHFQRFTTSEGTYGLGTVHRHAGEVGKYLETDLLIKTIVDFDLVMGFIYNIKNMEHHQPYPLSQLKVCHIYVFQRYWFGYQLVSLICKVLFSKWSFAGAVWGPISIQWAGRIAEIVFWLWLYWVAADCTSSGSNYSTYLIDVEAERSPRPMKWQREGNTWQGLYLSSNLHGQNNN